VINLVGLSLVLYTPKIIFGFIYLVPVPIHNPDLYWPASLPLFNSRPTSISQFMGSSKVYEVMKLIMLFFSGMAWDPRPLL
jgi:hypothetical protein